MSGYCRGREPGRHRECQLSGRCDEEGDERLQLQPPSLQKNFKIHNTPGAKQFRFAPISITLFKKGSQDSSEPSTHGYGTTFLLPTPHWLDNYNLSMKHSFEFT